MNTNGLARCYDTLTAWERLPLHMAALNRGDAAEAERLARTAPTRPAIVSHHYGLWDGFVLLSAIQLLTQLERICRMAGAAAGIVTGGGENEMLRQNLQTLIDLLKRDADAWKLLCADLKIDADGVLRHLPGCDLVRGMEEAAHNAASTLTEVAEGPAVKIDAPADMARGMREFLAGQEWHW